MLNTGITVILVMLSWPDIKKRELPGIFLWIMAASALLYAVFTRQADAWEIFGIALFSGGMISAGRIMHYGVGTGDGMLAGILCLFLGLRPGILVMWLAMILCGIWGMALILARRAGRKTKLPLVPFTAAAQIALWSLGVM